MCCKQTNSITSEIWVLFNMRSSATVKIETLIRACIKPFYCHAEQHYKPVISHPECQLATMCPHYLPCLILIFMK